MILCAAAKNRLHFDAAVGVFFIATKVKTLLPVLVNAQLLFGSTVLNVDLFYLFIASIY